MFQPKTFSETIRPILLLNILFGTGSIVLSKDQKAWKCVESVYMVIAWISFNIILSSHHIYRHALASTKINFNGLVATAWSVMSYELMTMLIFVTKFKMKSTQDLIEAIDRIDQKMQSIGLPSQYPIQYKHQIYHLSWWLAHVTVILVITWNIQIEPNAPIEDKIILTIAGNLIPIIITFVQLSFTLWVGYIRMNFRQLNHLLEEMIETTDHSGPKPFLAIRNSQVQKRRHLNAHAHDGNVETIAKVKKYHLDLIKIARRINKFYGMQLLLTTLIWLLTIVKLLYMFNLCIWQPLSTADIIYETCPLIIWLMINMSRMIHLHSNCMQTSNEAGKAGFLLCRLYNSSTSIQFRSEIQQFTHQVLENPLVLTVCGLVDIDRTFLSSVVGSIFAYLIVIVQLLRPQVEQRHHLVGNATDVNVTIIFKYKKPQLIPYFLLQNYHVRLWFPVTSTIRKDQQNPNHHTGCKLNSHETLENWIKDESWWIIETKRATCEQRLIFVTIIVRGSLSPSLLFPFLPGQLRPAKRGFQDIRTK
ncbi:putative gustatory receptor 28b [Halictus rubicundus]|uniref:putative gustatory receptor 28b n=1 Tax=Halictus rubicundus TaxID=77578 RepID=UPI004035EF80